MSGAQITLNPLVSLLSYCGHAEDCIHCASVPTVILGARTLLRLHLHLGALLLSTHTVHWSLEEVYKAYSTFSTSKESFHCRTGTFMTPFCYIKGTEDHHHLCKRLPSSVLT